MTPMVTPNSMNYSFSSPSSLPAFFILPHQLTYQTIYSTALCFAPVIMYAILFIAHNKITSFPPSFPPSYTSSLTHSLPPSLLLVSQGDTGQYYTAFVMQSRLLFLTMDGSRTTSGTFFLLVCRRILKTD